MVNWHASHPLTRRVYKSILNTQATTTEGAIMTATTRATYTTRTGNVVLLVTRDQAYNEWMLTPDFEGDVDDFIDTYFVR